MPSPRSTPRSAQAPHSATAGRPQSATRKAGGAKEEGTRKGETKKNGRPAAPAPPARIVIQHPSPSVDGGDYPAKRCIGDSLSVSVDLFRDGHELLRAVVRYRGPGQRRWREAALHRVDAHLDGVRWAGEIPTLDAQGRWEYAVEAWTDRFGTWRDELRRKVAAGQHDLSGELSEGVILLRETIEHPGRSGRSSGAPQGPGAGQALEDAKLIEHGVSALSDPDILDARKHETALAQELYEAVERAQPRYGSVCSAQPLIIEVDRARARTGAWYELFPRSFGGLSGVTKQLPKLAELGFDVIYLPPIHPIGLTNRKGRGNSLSADPKDPGSPWGIGDLRGGHEAIHPDLGTEEDLRRLVRDAASRDIDVAIDLAIQCSADHPWLTGHPEWFHHRPDGTLKYAENPPKRYQDIYNVNWDSEDWRGLWDAIRTLTLKWVGFGIKVFRVDNPHTKPFAFWEWLIAEVHKVDRDVIFLAEAFTKRATMRHLAKIGFSQSYTYFTWKNARWELIDYVSELAYSEEREYFRPNFFTNTPDILHAYLQHGGRPAFEARLVLAATLSPSYGIYSGFENVERAPAHEGSEEYLHSEKYEIRQRKLDGELLPLIARVNRARRENPALQVLDNITFLDTANEALIAYAKQSRANTVITVVNLDPHQAQEGLTVVPAHLNLPPSFTLHDLLDDTSYHWRIGPNYVRLAPGNRQAHVGRVEA
ncbi:MAG: alpha-1,4-glucan--maltose-1-phosphate maltosyltransferase [Solirubrobacteraceae bacterium]